MTMKVLPECLAMGREVRVAVCLEVKNQLILPDEVVEVECFFASSPRLGRGATLSLYN